MTPPQLVYAPAPHRRRLRLPARWLILVALAAAVAVAWWRGAPLWRAVQTLYWEHVCLNLEPPPGAVAMERDSTQAKALLDSKSGYEPIWGNPSLGACRVARAWRAFYALQSPAGLSSDGTLLVHQLISPGGQRRLVAVDARIIPTGPDAVPGHIELVSRVFLPSAGASPAREVVRAQTPSGLVLNQLTRRIYAARLDPADRSHFTIEWGCLGERQILDGWLHDNDTVIIEHRSHR